MSSKSSFLQNVNMIWAIKHLAVDKGERSLFNATPRPDSSVGRAGDWKSPCRWFDSASGHHTNKPHFCGVDSPIIWRNYQIMITYVHCQKLVKRGLTNWKAKPLQCFESLPMNMIFSARVKKWHCVGNLSKNGILNNYKTFFSLNSICFHRLHLSPSKLRFNLVNNYLCCLCHRRTMLVSCCMDTNLT